MPASSMTRMLALFDAFSAEHPTLTAEDIMARMGYSRGTAYRYVRELVAVGFLARSTGSAYTLGPRIIELDYAIRQCDPVLTVAIPIMQALRNKLECDVLLTSFYDTRVVVTHHERGGDAIRVSFGRGRVMPIFRGAPSKAILAWLSSVRQKKIYKDNSVEIATAGLGTSWPDFKAKLTALRKLGHCVSYEELEPGNVGVSVPLNAEPANTRSLSLVFSRSRYDIIDKALVIELLKAAGEQLDLNSAHGISSTATPLRPQK